MNLGKKKKFAASICRCTLWYSISCSVPLNPLIHHSRVFDRSPTLSQQCLSLYTSRDLYTASCALCCGVCWLLYTACGSFHKYLWPLWCYSQGLQSVRRLHHNTRICRPAVKGLVGLREWNPPAVALLYIFMAILLPYNSDVLKVENEEKGDMCWPQGNQTNQRIFILLSIRTTTSGQSLFQNICL